MTAFFFERNGKTYVVCWHKSGNCTLKLPLNKNDVTYEEQLGRNAIEIEITKEGMLIPVSKRRYFSVNISKFDLISAFEKAEIIE